MSEPTEADEPTVAVTVDRTLDADRVTVWRATADPALTEACLPGCEELRSEERPRDPTDDPLDAALDRPSERTFDAGETFEAELGIGAAGITLSYEVDVTVTEREFPEMRVEGEAGGEDGGFDTRATLTLSETEDGTEAVWHAEADVSGRAASIGAERLEPVVERVANGYFDAVEERLG